MTRQIPNHLIFLIVATIACTTASASEIRVNIASEDGLFGGYFDLASASLPVNFPTAGGNITPAITNWSVTFNSIIVDEPSFSLTSGQSLVTDENFAIVSGFFCTAESPSEGCSFATNSTRVVGFDADKYWFEEFEGQALNVISPVTLTAVPLPGALGGFGCCLILIKRKKTEVGNSGQCPAFLSCLLDRP